MTTTDQLPPAATIASAPPAKPKVAREVCEREFERLCQAYRIETSPEGLNSDELETFGDLRGHICDGIESGQLVIKENGLPTLKTREGEPLAFGKVTGATLLAGDGLQPFQFTRRAMLMATQLTGSEPGRMSKLDVDEFRICSDVVNLVLLRR